MTPHVETTALYQSTAYTAADTSTHPFQNKNSLSSSPLKDHPPRALNSDTYRLFDDPMNLKLSDLGPAPSDKETVTNLQNLYPEEDREHVSGFELLDQGSSISGSPNPNEVNFSPRNFSNLLNHNTCYTSNTNLNLNGPGAAAAASDKKLNSNSYSVLKSLSESPPRDAERISPLRKIQYESEIRTEPQTNKTSQSEGCSLNWRNLTSSNFGNIPITRGAPDISQGAPKMGNLENLVTERSESKTDSEKCREAGAQPNSKYSTTKSTVIGSETRNKPDSSGLVKLPKIDYSVFNKKVSDHSPSPSPTTESNCGGKVNLQSNSAFASTEGPGSGVRRPSPPDSSLFVDSSSNHNYSTKSSAAAAAAAGSTALSNSGPNSASIVKPPSQPPRRNPSQNQTKRPLVSTGSAVYPPNSHRNVSNNTNSYIGNYNTSNSNYTGSADEQENSSSSASASVTGIPKTKRIPSLGAANSKNRAARTRTSKSKSKASAKAKVMRPKSRPGSAVGFNVPAAKFPNSHFQTETHRSDYQSQSSPRIGHAAIQRPKSACGGTGRGSRQPPPVLSFEGNSSSNCNSISKQFNFQNNDLLNFQDSNTSNLVLSNRDNISEVQRPKTSHGYHGLSAGSPELMMSNSHSVVTTEVFVNHGPTSMSPKASPNLLKEDEFQSSPVTNQPAAAAPEFQSSESKFQGTNANSNISNDNCMNLKVQDYFSFADLCAPPPRRFKVGSEEPTPDDSEPGRAAGANSHSALIQNNALNLDIGTSNISKFGSGPQLNLQSQGPVNTSNLNNNYSNNTSSATPAAIPSVTGRPLSGIPSVRLPPSLGSPRLAVHANFEEDRSFGAFDNVNDLNPFSPEVASSEEGLSSPEKQNFNNSNNNLNFNNLNRSGNLSNPCVPGPCHGALVGPASSNGPSLNPDLNNSFSPMLLMAREKARQELNNNNNKLPGPTLISPEQEREIRSELAALKGDQQRLREMAREAQSNTNSFTKQELNGGEAAVVGN